jgi:hypothetical protein
VVWMVRNDIVKVVDATFGRTWHSGFWESELRAFIEIKYLHLKLRVMRIMKCHSQNDFNVSEVALVERLRCKCKLRLTHSFIFYLLGDGLPMLEYCSKACAR